MEAEEAEATAKQRHCLAIDNMSEWQLQMMREILSWGDDVGLLEAIASTSALTADAVPWSGLWDGRGRGFGVIHTAGVWCCGT